MEFGDLLQEFNDVVEELRVPSQSTPYGQLLSEAKRRTGANDGVSDSGIEDSDYSEFLQLLLSQLAWHRIDEGVGFSVTIDLIQNSSTMENRTKKQTKTLPVDFASK